MFEQRDTRRARTTVSRAQLVGIGIVVTLIALLIALSVTADDGDVNCVDLANQRTAQAIYDRDPNDPHDLDGNDNDGRPCEGRPK